jgi:Icc-related predicted phosphoesterase
MLKRSLVILSLFSFLACTKNEPAPAEPKQEEKSAANDQAKAVEKKTAQRRSSEQCVGPFVSEPVKTVKIGAREWELKGSTLTEKTSDPDDTMVVGVIADLKEDIPDNLSNIDKFLSFFKQEKVELIIVNGDTGESKTQIANNLKRVAASGVPVGIIIGNRECQEDFTAAVAEVSEKAQNVFNLNVVRRIVADDAEFVTMPGYYNASYLHCVEGCQYWEEDVAALGPIVDQAKHPVTLISHGPPRQASPNALDRISEGTNEGDPSLAKFLADKKIPFGIFANIHEAGGKATDLSGENQIKEGTFVDSLYVNPGPGDSLRWTMNSGAESVGMAAVVTYKGKQASYKIYRLSPQVAKKK